MFDVRIGDEKLSNKLRIDELIEAFKNKPFTSEELFRFYIEKEPDLKKTTFRWRVYILKNDGVIQSPKRGLYITESKKKFEPDIDERLYKLYKKIRNKFPYSDICIWKVTWLNNYMVHQSISNNIIVEVDKEATDSVFAFVQESNNNVYLNPGKYEIQTYILPGQNNIIIKNLVVGAPKEDKGDIVIPKIEKIIVDLFADDELYVTYQGGELKSIYEELFNNFSINQSTLYRYASRRNVKDRIITYLKEETAINPEEIYI